MVLSSKSRRKKLAALAEIEGFDTAEDMIEATSLDVVSPAICINDDCDYTAEMEPDQTEGWCEMCDTNTVQAALVLAGLI